VLAVAGTSLSGGVAWGLPNQFNYFTGAGQQNWLSPANWSQGAPGAEDHVRIVSSGTLDINAPGAATLSLAVGYGDNLTPTVNLLPGGSLVSGNDVVFGGTGAVAGSNNVLATLNQTGGNLLIPANRILWMGLGGSAVWNMSGGTTTVGYPGFSSLTNLGISIGTGVGALPSTATLNMTGGTINSDAVFEVARGNATGNLNMSGGTINVGTEVWIGQFGSGGGLATINHSGGTINTGYNQYGVNSFSGFLMGIGNAGNPANYTLSGTGVVNSYGHMYVGGGVSALAGATGGEGNFVMNGGTVNVGDARQVSGSSLFIGWSPGAADSKGAVVVNDGTLSLNLPGSDIVVGSFQNNAGPLPTGQSASLTINGGQVLNPRGSVVIGRTGANGTLNLAGGLLAVNSLVWANPAGNTNVRQFDWTGGTLEANTAQLGYALTNDGGTFRPGGSVARTFTTAGGNGSYAQNAGTLSIDLASAARFDAIDASAGGVGAVNLNGGTVNVAAIGGFAPSFGVTVPVIKAKTISDSATWTLPALPAGFTWDKRISTDGANQVETITAIRTAASTLTSGASWTTASWSTGAPNGIDASAKLAGAGGSISINSPVTVGYLQLDGSPAWSIDGASTLTIATAGGATGGIAAFGPGSNAIGVPVAFNSNAAIATQLGSTAVTLAGAVSGNTTVEKTGPGSLTLTSATSTFTGTWKISGGSLNVASDANLGATSATLSLANAALNVGGGFNSARAIALDGTNTLTAGGDSALSGQITGSGGLTKLDANVLTLSGANTFSGPTNVNAGTLRQGAANAVPSGSALTLAAGTSFDLGGANASVGSIAGAGNISTGGATLTVGNDNSSTVFSGVVSGFGTFVKNGTGTLEFNRPADAGASAAITPIDGNIIVNGGTLQFNALNQTTYDLPFNDITVNAGANLSLNTTGAAGPNGGAFFNSIHGAGTLTIGASYLVMLTAPSDYTGGTIITGGATASITDLAALGASGTPIRFKGSGTRDNSYAGGLWFEIGDHVTPTAGTFSHPISVDGWKLAILSTRGNDITLDRPITGDGGIQYASGGFGGTFRLNASSTYKGVTQVDPDVAIVLGADNALPRGAIAVNGSLDLNGHAQTLGYLVSFGTPAINLNGGTLTLSSDIEQQFGGAWTGTINGNGALIKSGGATQVFQLPAGNASTYTGGTTVQQGTLQIIDNVNALPAGGPVTVDPGGVLQFTTAAVASGLAAGTPVTFSGKISGGGEVQVTSLETLVLSGNNTYSGGTRISNGTLLVTADSNLGAPTGKITFYSNGSNPGPILQYGASLTSARDLVVENAFGYLDTNGFNSSVANIVGNTDPTYPLGSFRKLFGSGTLTANRVRVNALTVSAGTLKVAPGGTASSTSSSTSLTIDPGASLDLSDNDMVVDYAGASPLVGIVDSFKAAYNSGAWDGAGLTSSSAAANGRTTLAIVDNSAYGFSAFGGLPVDSTSLLIKYTWYGDLNLNGKVDADDYALLDRSLAKGGLAGSATWVNGDVNYSGTVDSADYLLVDRAFALQTGILSPALLAQREVQFGADYVSQLVAAVPEPTTLSFLSIPVAALGAKRRRR
jgi:autotransporter-associated beta strand protein